MEDYPVVRGENVEDLIECARSVEGGVDYLEIGTNEGSSLYHLFRGAFVKSATIVDTWGKEYGGTNRGSPDHIIKLMGSAMSRIRVMSIPSTEALKQLREEGKTFDLIFVDGDHSDQGCMSDMVLAWPLLRSGGWLVVDDVDHPAHPYLRDTVIRFAQDLEIIWTPHHYGVARIQSP